MGRERFTTTDYRRCARRLRHLHRDHPARLVRRLSDLSRAYDALIPRSIRPHPLRSTAQVCDFAQRVADQVDGTTLRYSNRIKLLREARRHDIDRFDANLIIAAVQNRVQRSGFRVQDERGDRSWKISAFLFVVIQGIILAGAGYVVAL